MNKHLLKEETDRRLKERGIDMRDGCDPKRYMEIEDEARRHMSEVEMPDGTLMSASAARAQAITEGVVDDVTSLMEAGVTMMTATTLASRIQAAGGTVEDFCGRFLLTDAAEGEHLRIEEVLGGIRSGDIAHGSDRHLLTSHAPGERLW